MSSVTPQLPPTSLASATAWSARLRKYVSKRLSGSSADPDADRLGVRLALLQALHGPLPLLLGRGHRDDLADRRRDDREDLAAERGDERQAVLDVLDARQADVVVLVHEVAAAGHQRHRAPALDTVLVEQPLDLVGVIGRRLARDLDPVVAAAPEPRDRRLDRLGAHPVVHRHLQCDSLSSPRGPTSRACRGS